MIDAWSCESMQAFWRIRSKSIRQETVFYASLVFPISMAPIQLPGATEKPPDLPQLNIALRQGLQGAVIVTIAPETVIPTVQVSCAPHPCTITV